MAQEGGYQQIGLGNLYPEGDEWRCIPMLNAIGNQLEGLTSLAPEIVQGIEKSAKKILATLAKMNDNQSGEHDHEESSV